MNLSTVSWRYSAGFNVTVECACGRSIFLRSGDQTPAQAKGEEPHQYACLDCRRVYEVRQTLVVAGKTETGADYALAYVPKPDWREPS